MADYFLSKNRNEDDKELEQKIFEELDKLSF